jgi:hypothetical protein
VARLKIDSREGPMKIKVEPRDPGIDVSDHLLSLFEEGRIPANAAHNRAVPDTGFLDDTVFDWKDE